MPVLSTVSLEEYLRTSYEPECEFIDGELFPKSMGSNRHSALQLRLGVLLAGIPGVGSRGRTEQNLRIRNQMILIPDVCILREENDDDVLYIEEPPTLCVEILSPSDRLVQAAEKCRIYLRWGVSACWVLDPIERRGWNVTLSSLDEIEANDVFEAGQFSLPASAVFPLK